MRVASIWLVPSPPSARAIEQLMREVDGDHPTWPRFTPHLTLQGGSVSPEQLLTELPKLARTGSIVAPVSGLDCSPVIFKTLFLTFDNDHPGLKAARSVLSPVVDYEFKPHVSLVYCTQAQLDNSARADLLRCFHPRAMELGSVEFTSAVVVSPKNGATWEMIADWEVLASVDL